MQLRWFISCPSTERKEKIENEEMERSVQVLKRYQMRQENYPLVYRERKICSFVNAFHCIVHIKPSYFSIQCLMGRSNDKKRAGHS